MLPIASKNGQSLGFFDSLFTATSAVCITGLVVVDTGTHFTRFGQFIIILLVQIGGLGIMTMSTLIALILGKRIGLRERILIQESFNQYNLSGLIRLIINVLTVTFMFEFLGGLILSLRFWADFSLDRALAFGFFHSISSFCNAGFDLFGQVYGEYCSITPYVNDWVVKFTTAGLVISGGLGFPVINELFQYSKTKKLSLHAKMVIRISLLLILTGTVLIFLVEIANKNTIGGLDHSGKFLGALFQSITTRSSGYNSLDISQMNNASWFIMIILMFIGGSPSSTGGGIKTTTAGVLITAVIATIRGKQDVEIFERRLPQDLINKAFTITFVSLSWVCFGTLIMSLVEPFSFIKLFFEVMSAFGTVGLSTGITNSLTDLSRLLLVLTMFMGRVGPLTIMLAITTSEKTQTGRYITDRVMIG